MTEKPLEKDCEQRLFSACRYLIDNGQLELAESMANCQITNYRYEVREIDPYDVDSRYQVFVIYLQADKSIYKILHEWNSAIEEDKNPNAGGWADLNTLKGRHIDFAFSAVFSDYHEHRGVEYKCTYGSVEFNKDWRTTLLAAAESSEVITNQDAYNKKPMVWNGMRFRSPAEIEIAKVLENLGVMYFPNCLVRVGAAESRGVYFPDFLICYQGKWGMLEVDGKQSHSGRATDDYNRNRAIRQHGGINWFDRYDAMYCQNNAKAVVEEFLKNLASN